MDFICEQCGSNSHRDRSVRRPPPRFCSSKCWGAWQRAQARSSTCARCGASFRVRQSEAVRGGGLWCSRHCYVAGRSETQAFACEHCRTSFTLPRYKVEHRIKYTGASPRFCSRKCSNAARRNEPQACEECGAAFYAQPSRRRARYCSSACRHAGHSKRMTALANGWAPPAGSEYGPNWYRQARLARQRDNHTCQTCGARRQGRQFPVHHLRHHNAFDGDWETANRLENLITLCERCHRATERANGRR